MTMRDKALEAKVALQQKARSIKVKVSSTTTISNSSAKTAAKLSKFNTKSSDQFILDLITKINEAASQGLWLIQFPVPNGYQNKVGEYFTKKGYIILSYKSKSKPNLVISWGGGKAWIKSRGLNESTNEEIGKELIDELIGELTRSITPTEIGTLNWINPNTRNQKPTGLTVYNKVKDLP